MVLRRLSLRFPAGLLGRGLAGSLLVAVALASCGDDGAPGDDGLSGAPSVPAGASGGSNAPVGGALEPVATGGRGGDGGAGAQPGGAPDGGGPEAGGAIAAPVAGQGGSLGPGLAGSSSGGAGDGGGGHAGKNGEAGEGGAPPLPPGEWIGVVGVGQSISVGVRGTPVLSTSQPYRNLKLSLGSLESSWPIAFDDPELSMVPLVEPMRTLASKCCSSPYPLNIYGETYHTAMSVELSRLHELDLQTELVSVHVEAGQSATGIAGIEKGGTGHAYAASLFEVQAIKRLADASGASFRVGAVVLTHGETDADRASYQDELVQLQADYDQDLRAITGQAGAIPMLVSQQNVAGRDGRPVSSLAAWQAANSHPDAIVCIGPKYQYQHSGDNLHLTSSQYRRLGAKYAQVFHEFVVLGKNWEPVQPVQVNRVDDLVTVVFNVPVPPLAWDESLGWPHQLNHTAWAVGRGFELEDSLGELELEAVDIVGDDTVEIVLGRLPVVTSEQPLHLRYAMTQDVVAWSGGQSTGRIGQLRDSDPFVDLLAETAECEVINGSPTIKRAGGGSFPNRAERDAVMPVSGSGLGSDARISVISADRTTLTLSEPWTGPSGTVELELRARHWNHAVAFEWVVP